MRCFGAPVESESNSMCLSVVLTPAEPIAAMSRVIFITARALKVNHQCQRAWQCKTSVGQSGFKVISCDVKVMVKSSNSHRQRDQKQTKCEVSRSTQGVAAYLFIIGIGWKKTNLNKKRRFLLWATWREVTEQQRRSELRLTDSVQPSLSRVLHSFAHFLTPSI